MRCVVTTMLAVALLPLNTARADWAYTKWGMTPEQVAKASGGAVAVLPADKRRTIKEINLENAAEGTFIDGKLRLRVNFSFDTRTGGLACIGYVVEDKAQGEQLRDWLVQRYGKPQNVSGLPAIGMQSLSWTKPDEINLDLVTGEPAYVLHCSHDSQG